jgi:hypothetical protein
MAEHRDTCGETFVTIYRSSVRCRREKSVGQVYVSHSVFIAVNESTKGSHETRNTNRADFVCYLHAQIAAKNYFLYLLRCEISYGLELLSTEVRNAELNVMPHVPLI